MGERDKFREVFFQGLGLLFVQLSFELLCCFVRGKVILQPQGKEFFTCRGKNFFTSCGKEFFT